MFLFPWSSLPLAEPIFEIQMIDEPVKQQQQQRFHLKMILSERSQIHTFAMLTKSYLFSNEFFIHTRSFTHSLTPRERERERKKYSERGIEKERKRKTEKTTHNCMVSNHNIFLAWTNVDDPIMISNVPHLV